MKRDDILITGYSRIQSGTTAAEQYGGWIAVSIIVNRYTGVLQDIECTLTTGLAREYIHKALVGMTLENIEQIEEELKENYFGAAKKPVIAALHACQNRYHELKG